MTFAQENFATTMQTLALVYYGIMQDGVSLISLF